MKTLFKRCAIPLYRLLPKNQMNMKRHSTMEIAPNGNIDHNNISSFHSMKKSRRVLEYFSHHYMCHHNMEPVDIMRYIDHLTFVESLAYLVDDDNERANNSDRTLKYDSSHIDTISDDEFNYNVNQNQAFSILYRYLKQYNFYDSYTHKQLYNGILYYKIEQYLCDALEKPNNGEKKLSKYLIDKCNSLRSFDFRLLNLVTYKLTKQPYNDDIIKFLFYIELNFETLDDLRTYEEDALNGTYNIYRMYVNLYKNDAKLYFEKYCRDLDEKLTKIFNSLLLKYPKLPKLHRHERTFTLEHKEITPTQFHITRNWNMPKPILDEYTWRKDSSCGLLTNSNQVINIKTPS